MTPYARKLLGIPLNAIIKPRKLIFPKTYFKLIKKIFFRRWRRNIIEWVLI